MKWLNNIIDRRLQNIRPSDEKKYGKGEARIIPRNLERISKDISKWRQAQQDAEDLGNPERTELMQIYKDVLDDSQVYSNIQIRIAKSTSGHLGIYKDNEFDEAISNFFVDNKGFALPWLRRFLTYAEWAKFYGAEAINLGPWRNNKFEWIKKLPEENLVPQWSGFIFDYEMAFIKDGTNFMRYDDKKIVNWLIPVGETNDLGLLNKITPYMIWKEVFGSWSMHADLYGQPLRIGKTNIADPERKQNMMDMLAAMTQGAYAAIDMEDIIELIQEQKSDPYNIYKELINVCDEAISKLILGGTMVTDSGSSRSQSEVHERTMGDVIYMDKIDLQTLVNEKLIPRMQKLNIIPEGEYAMVWDMDETLSITEWANVFQQLSLAGFKPTTEEVQNKVGLELQEIEQPEQDENNIRNLYKDYLNGTDIN